MFIAVLFTRAKTEKQPKHPLTEERVRKMWYIYTMDYYSAIKKNKSEPVVIQSEETQKEKNTYCISCICMESKKKGQMNLFVGKDVRTDLWTQLREKRVGRTEKVALTFIQYYV